MIPGSESQPPNMSALLWTVFFGVLVIRREIQLRGGGPTGRARWVLFGCLGVVATFFWLMFTGTNLRPLLELRGGSAQDQDGKPPPPGTGTDGDDKESQKRYLLIPSKAEGRLLMVEVPGIQCPVCQKKDKVGLSWQPAGEYSSWRDFMVMKATEDPAVRKPADPKKKKEREARPQQADDGQKPAAGSPPALPPHLEKYRGSDFANEYRAPPNFQNPQSTQVPPYGVFGHDPKFGYGSQPPPTRTALLEGKRASINITEMLANIDSSKIKPESLSYTLFFTYLPGMCMNGFTERRQPCTKDLEAKWQSHGIWSTEFRKLIPPMLNTDAHPDSRLGELKLRDKFEAENFPKNLKEKVSDIWPTFTTTMKIPAVFVYFNQAPVLQFAPELKSFEQYLTKVVELSEKHDVSGALKDIQKGKEGIPTKRFLDAFKEAKPQLLCRRISHGTMESKDEIKVLTKIGICFSHDLKIKDCPYPGTCNEKVYYLENFESPE